MIRKIPLFYRCAGWLMVFTAITAPVADAQRTPPVQPLPQAAGAAFTPESLPKFLSDSNELLAKEIASLQEQVTARRQALRQVAKEKEEFAGKIATLKASMALKQLAMAQAEEELGVLQKRDAEVASRVKAFGDQLKALEANLREKTESLAVLQKQIASLRQTRHPLTRSTDMQASYQTYLKLAGEYERLAKTNKEILENILASLEAEHSLVTETRTHLQKEYLGKTLKEELLKPQTLQQRVEQLVTVLQTLAAIPGNVHTWAMFALQSGLLVLFIEKYWASLLGLLLFLLLLGVGTHKFKALVLPGLAAWKEQVPELGLTALLVFVQILGAHLFSMGFAAWLYVSFFTLGILEANAAWLIFHGVATLVVLRLALSMLQSLLAGEAQQGLLPLPDTLAGYYRRHLKALAVYFFAIGVFIIPNARHLGFTPESAGFLRHLFQMVLLGWVFWMLRSRHLDPALQRLPVPPFFAGKAFLRTLRSVVFLVFTFVVVANLLGFRFFSDYVAEVASFTVVVLALSWVLGQGAYAVLRLTLHPELGFLAQKYPEHEKSFARLYRVLTQAVIAALAAVAVLVALKVWGIEPDRLEWALQWLSRGPALGPVHLTPMNVGLTILVIYLGFWVSRVMRTFLDLKFYPRTDWDPGIRYTISTTLHYVLLLITVLIALNILGASLTNLALVAGGLGVGVGFGLQNMVSNFASGFTLLFERSIKVGDMLVIDGLWGTVKEIRMRCTIFQTYDRSVLIIPNSELLSKTILNWTYFGWGTNRLTLKVGVSYGSDPRRVTEIIEGVCRANPRVIKDPPPQIFFEAYGDSSLNFTAWVYVGSPTDRIRATHELNSAIFEAFQANGIEIPFPQRDLHIKSWPRQAPPPPAFISPAQE